MRLTTAEMKFRDAVKADEACIFEDSPLFTTKKEEGESPMDFWDRVDSALAEESTTRLKARTLRAEVVGKILRGEKLTAKGKPISLPRQIGVVGAYIAGQLDIANTTIPAILGFNACEFSEGLQAEGAKIKGDVFLRQARFQGMMNIKGAEIGGQFAAEGAHFINPKATALWAQGVQIKENLVLRYVYCQGKVAINGATISGQFDAHAAHFDNPDGRALWAQGVRIKASMFLRQVLCLGVVDINSAKIEGQFDAHAAHFVNKNGTALHAQGVQIRAGMFLRQVHFQGAVDVNSAEIGGQFDADSAYFANLDGIALRAQTIQVKTDVFLEQVYCQGEVNISGAEIGGQFSAIGACFVNPDRYALWAQNAQIKAGMFLDAIRCQGVMAVNGTDIEGQFSANGACFNNPNGNALDGQGARINGGVWMRELASAPKGRVGFDEANISSFVIDDTFWPLGRVHQDGLIYQRLEYEGTQVEGEPWRGWLTPPPISEVRKKALLAAQHEEALTEAQLVALNKKYEPDIEHFTPQPWLHFAKVLRDRGDEREERKTRIQMERRMTGKRQHDLPRRLQGQSWFSRQWMRFTHFLYLLWRRLYRVSAGYGVEPWLAGRGLVALCALGWLIFAVGYRFDHMEPAKERFYLSGAYAPYVNKGILPEAYPHFDAPIYALDVMLPVVDFGQEVHWRPKNVEVGLWGIRWNWLRWYNRLHLIAGWFFATIGLLGFTGLVVRGRKEG